MEDRDWAERPFSNSSPWNTPLGSARLAPGKADPCTRDLTDPKLTAWINAAEWSHPVYRAVPADPLVGIYLGGKQVARIRVPPGARPAQPDHPAHPGDPVSDASLHVIDPTGRFVDEMWRARRRPDHGWDVEGHTRNDLRGPGAGQGGERAYGGSALGGLLRKGELRQGIHHALALSLPRSHLRHGPVWPATKEDDGAEGTYTGHVPLGQRVALPKDADLGALHLSPAGLAVARALQEYGGYVVDAAEDFNLYAVPELEAEIGPAREDLPRLRGLLRCVDQPVRGQ